jgi:charged multivesicular body protein 2A
MMQSMKGATQLLGSMNRSMNLPALQRIAMDFERENDIMDQRQEMFEEATDDIGLDDEEESDEIVNQVLDEIGVDLGQSVRILSPSTHEITILTTYQLGETPSGISKNSVAEGRIAQAIGGGDAEDDDLQARLDSLRK